MLEIIVRALTASLALLLFALWVRELWKFIKGRKG